MNYVIRKAEANDVEAVVELGRRFLYEGPYRGIIEDRPEEPRRMMAMLLSSDDGRVIVAEAPDKSIVGVFAIYLHPGLYTGLRTAGEVIWYVSTEHRRGGLALRLLAEAERQAKEMGAEVMTLTAPTEEVAALYKRCGGYRLVEVGFQRRLN